MQRICAIKFQGIFHANINAGQKSNIEKSGIKPSLEYPYRMFNIMLLQPLFSFANMLLLHLMLTFN